MLLLRSSCLVNLHIQKSILHIIIVINDFLENYVLIVSFRIPSLCNFPAYNLSMIIFSI